MNPVGARKAWTFLFYNVGQGNLAPMTTAGLESLERVGSDEHTDVVALNYRERPKQERVLGRFGEYEGARCYHVTRGASSGSSWLGSLADIALASPKNLQSEIIGQPVGPGEAFKMADPATLKAFLLENMARFPAEHFALTITGHGAAFQGQAIVRGPEGRSAISNDDLARVLREVAQESGKSVDLVNLNTCYSANLESLYSLKDSTRALVASQAALSLATQPFGPVLAEVQQRLAAGCQVSPQDLARVFVEQAAAQPLSGLYSPTLSALDASALGKLGASVGSLQKACQEQGIEPKVLRECLTEALGIDFSGPVQLTDLGSLAGVMASRIDDKKVREAAARVGRDLQAAVLAEQHAEPGRQSLLERGVRSLPFLVGPPADLSGATGLTVFWNPEEKERLELIGASSFGKDQPLTGFMEYLAG
ncbi:MAG: hypothetical protein KF760_30735 [Candidatus Eremiobacteraeota bacterium]|nr:hypothetical protein [Candidatus Eremiobacteraeota bacterium]MCW5868624.1 hypothetical protein [Candidatus Eremiobacteraeota bacterium]